MNKRSGHVSKSRAERDSYNRLIRQQDFEPTKKAEILDFKESIDKEEDYSVPTATRPRQHSIFDRILDHVKEKFAGYICSAFGCILFFCMYYSKIDLATIKEKLNGLENKTKNIKSKVDKNYDKLHEQEIQIKENKIHIDNLKDKK